MSLKSIIGLLRRHDLFAGLAEARLEVIAFTAERQSFEAGELIFEAGEEGHDALLILTGNAEMGGQIIAEGDLIGEAALLSLTPQGPQRRASVRARTRVEALAVSRYLFHRLMQEFPEMAGSVAAALTRRLAQTTQEMNFLVRDLDQMRAERKDGRQG